MQLDRVLRVFSVVVLTAMTLLASRFHPALPYDTRYDYLHRPPGYHWRPARDPNTGDTVYYGFNPVNHYTVYVGPDNIYYQFAHPPPITPSDLGSTWTP